MDLITVVSDLAAALKAVDQSRPQGKSRTRTYRPGVGPLAEADALNRALIHLKSREKQTAYASAGPRLYPGSRQFCDLVIPNSWAIECKLLRPFGDNGDEAEHWSDNILHPYPGNRSTIGDCLKLHFSTFTERKAVVVFGYEHNPAQINLGVTIQAFETIARDLIGLSLGNRYSAEFTDLIHPVHQQGKVYGWELLGLTATDLTKQELLAAGHPLEPDEYVKKQTTAFVMKVGASGTSTTTKSKQLSRAKTNYGKVLNEQFRVGAKHALYHKDGTWYMPLERFPGALFDPNGYVLFPTEKDFLECGYIKIGRRVQVPSGISRIPGYKRMR